jgi:hypothetical protein
VNQTNPNCGKDFPFINTETGEQVNAYSNSQITWLVKTGNEMPVHDGTGQVTYQEEEIAMPWEKFIERYKPASPDGAAFLSSCLLAIMKEYQEKINLVKKFLDSIS